MSHWRLSVFRLSVTVCVHCVHDRLCTTRTRYLANHLWEFLLNLWLRCSLELVRHWGQRSRSRPTVESEVKVYCGVRGHGQGLLWGQRSWSRPTVGSEVMVKAYCGVRGQCQGQLWGQGRGLLWGQGQGQLWGQRSRSRLTVGSEVKVNCGVRGQGRGLLWSKNTCSKMQLSSKGSVCRSTLTVENRLVVNYFLFYCDIVWIEFCPFRECWSFCC